MNLSFCLFVVKLCLANALFAILLYMSIHLLLYHFAFQIVPLCNISIVIMI